MAKQAAQQNQPPAPEQASDTVNVEALKAELKAAVERAEVAEGLLNEADVGPLKASLEAAKKELAETKRTLTVAERDQAELAKFRTRVEELAGQNKQLKKDAAVAEERAKVALAEAREYRERLERSSMSALPALTKNSWELVTSVTILDSQDVRIEPRKGDVVTTDPPEPLAQKLGGKCRVYQVTLSTIDELGQAKLIRQ